MTGKDIVGLIHSGGYDRCLPELTAHRTMGSIPFGGRYRLIDFMLSNMVNFGMSKVGVLTKHNYRSLMDHIGTGRPWDLSRKREGLFLLPPFNTNGAGDYDNRMSAYLGATDFLRLSREEYVLLCDCNAVCNLDLEGLTDFHAAKGADITIAYTCGKVPKLNDLATLTMDETARVTQIEIFPETDKERAFSTNILLMKKSLLLSLITDANSRGLDQFARDILMKNTDSLKIYGYRIPGYSAVIDSLQSYYDTNMSLLAYANRSALFTPERPVLTKVRDDMPTIYGLDSDVKNSLIADGCIINGEVENCVLSRGVHIEKGAVVKNCVLMQETYIGEDTTLNCVIADKNVVIKPRKHLSGAENYPLYIEKNKVI